MASVIDWQAVFETRKLSDGDRISCATAPADFFIVITLARATPGMWWKQVEVCDKTGARIMAVEVDHDQGRVTGSLTSDADKARARDGGYIVLWKAKTFGIKTPMYVLTNLDQHLTDSTQFNFTWVDD